MQKQSFADVLQIGVLKKFAKFTRKHLCQTLFFSKVAGLRPKACNFIEKETLVQVFTFEFWEIFKNTFFNRTPRVAALIMYNMENLR